MSRTVTRALVAAVVDPLAAEPLDRDLHAAVAAAARTHRVAGAVQLAFGIQELADDVTRARAAHRRALGDLAAAGAALDAADVRWLVMKGPVLAEAYWGAIQRSYGDLDLVVHPSDFARALDVLAATGAELDRNWTLLRDELRGEVHVLLRFGTVADVHWHLVNHHREPFAIDMGEVFDRSRVVRVAGLRVPTLDVADTLLHVALHAATSGGWRLQWLKDIERCLAVDAPDWDDVVSRAHAWRAGAPVGVMLARAARLLGADVPPHAVRELAGRRHLRTIVDRVAPLSDGPAAPASIVARTAGRGGRGSLAVLRDGVRTRRAVAAASERHGHLVLVPTGDDDDRAAYLEQVAAYGSAATVAAGDTQEGGTH